MRHIDQQYTRTPFYGSRRVTVYLNGLGYAVNRKRVQRLMRLMGLAGVAPGPHMSGPHPIHAIHPYLLRDLVIDHPNQVWCTDVTYIPMHRGFLFLVAILDWYSRYVVAWMVSNTQDTAFCLQALEQAFTHGCPEIFNSDQGAVSSPVWPSPRGSKQLGYRSVWMDEAASLITFVSNACGAPSNTNICICPTIAMAQTWNEASPPISDCTTPIGLIKPWAIERRNRFILRIRLRLESTYKP